MIYNQLQTSTNSTESIPISKRPRTDSQTVNQLQKTLNPQPQPPQYMNESNKRHIRKLKLSLKKFEIQECCFSENEKVFDFLEKLCVKFEFKLQTIALALYFWNRMYWMRLDKQQEHEKNWMFYSSVCLIIAAKAVEFDYIVPLFSRFQRHADTSFKIEEYQEKEMELLQLFQFDVQIPTFEILINHYLDIGIIFENDKVEDKSQVEDKVREMTRKYIKNGVFLIKNQELLALKIVMEARNQLKLQWSPSIEEQARYAFSESEKRFIVEFKREHDEIIESKIDFSEKLAERISKKNNQMKVTSPFPLSILRPLQNIN